MEADLLVRSVVPGDVMRVTCIRRLARLAFYLTPHHTDQGRRIQSRSRVRAFGRQIYRKGGLGIGSLVNVPD